jgi:predicted Zn finger-like uncharacterized protein
VPFEITCPKCGQSIRVPSAHEGKPVKCPRCRQRFTIPGRDSGSSDKWFLKKSNGTEYGPVAREILDRWSLEGRIDRNCLIRKKGTSEWQKASKVYDDLPHPGEKPAHAMPTLEDFDLETLTESTATDLADGLFPAESNLDANRAVSKNDSLASPRISRVLGGTSPITMFLAFAGFVTTGAIAALLAIRMGHAVRTENRSAVGWAFFDLVAICLLILLPTWHTFLYHRRLKEFVGSPTEKQLAIALEQDQRFWKALLVLPAVGLVYVLVRLVAAGGSPFSS